MGFITGKKSQSMNKTCLCDVHITKHSDSLFHLYIRVEQFVHIQHTAVIHDTHLLYMHLLPYTKQNARKSILTQGNDWKAQSPSPSEESHLQVRSRVIIYSPCVYLFSDDQVYDAYAFLYITLEKQLWSIIMLLSSQHLRKYGFQWFVLCKYIEFRKHHCLNNCQHIRIMYDELNFTLPIQCCFIHQNIELKKNLCNCWLPFISKMFDSAKIDLSL